MFPPSFAVNLFDFILLSETKDYRAFFGQIFPVIANSGRDFNLLIENLDFILVDSERHSAWIKSKTWTAKLSGKLVFCRDLVSDISFLVDGEGVVEIVEFKFKNFLLFPPSLLSSSSLGSCDRRKDTFYPHKYRLLRLFRYELWFYS